MNQNSHSLLWAETILNWYAEHRRCLPWRNISDPYRIWVSEIILQQTRVVQGYDYYRRFIEAFPNVQALSQATEDEVLRLWQGLGYYSRARNMHAAAQQIMHDFGGSFPDTYAGIRSLKGVGDYTAAAIASFAFGLPHAVVDGNVYRVLSRYFAIETPIDSTTGKREFAELATNLLPETRCADYNQALMDFGALQCVPSNPNCEDCPLTESCLAHASNWVNVFPVKQHQTKVSERYFVYIKVITPQGIWLHRRQGNDIWHGLYEYPLLEFDHPADFEEVLQSSFVHSVPSAKGTWKTLRKKFKHVLTHRVIHADLYALEFAENVAVPEGFVLVKPEEQMLYGMPQILFKMEP